MVLSETSLVAMYNMHCILCYTVDGKNPAPADMANIPSFTEFYTFEVVQDFFHQQYD